MGAKVYTLKITYKPIKEKIWRICAVSSNYTLQQLGYLVLASFNCGGCFDFTVKLKNSAHHIPQEIYSTISTTAGLLKSRPLSDYNINISDCLLMEYGNDFIHEFSITIIAIEDMPRSAGKGYPKIIDGSGRGIVDSADAKQLITAINKTDSNGHSGIYHLPDQHFGKLEWDYRTYSKKEDNILLKPRIERLQTIYKDKQL